MSRMKSTCLFLMMICWVIEPYTGAAWAENKSSHQSDMFDQASLDSNQFTKNQSV